MKIDKQKMNKLRTHNALVRSGKISTELSGNEVQDVYENTMGNLVKGIIDARLGKKVDKYGRKIPAVDITLSQALEATYNVDLATYLKQLEIYKGSDTLESAARRLGHDNFNMASLKKSLIEHSTFGAGLSTTEDINDAWRFIIPELIISAIRLDYDAASMASNWIASTTNVTQRDVKMPHIKRGNTVPRKIGEAESIPFGSVAFGQKSASVQKVGIGFKITDELVEASSLDLMFQFLGEVGNDMSIARDVEAFDVLVNGEQADSSESAPVVGVETTTAFAFKDIKRGVSRMKRLKRMVDRIITSEDDGINISLLDELKGFNGGTTLTSLRSILGVPDTLENDVFVPPTDQMMLLASGSCMTELKYGSMKVEERRNAQSQENEMFVSDNVGYAIIRRDGRLLMDKSIAYSGNGFPSYMDIDTRINQAFESPYA